MTKPDTTILRLCILLAFLLIEAAGPRAAQTVYLKDGSTITGQIIPEESNAQFTVIDVFTGKTTIPTSSIVRVVESDSFADHLAQAQANQRRRRWLEAAQAYHRAFQSTSNQEQRSQLQREIQAIARQLLSELEAGNPQDLPVQECLKVAEWTGLPTLVEQMKRRVREFQNNRLNQWIQQGRLYVEQGNDQAALKMFDQVIAAATDFPELAHLALDDKAGVYIKKSEPLYQSSDLEEQLRAEDYLLNALSIQPDNDKANYMLGYVYYKKGQLRQTLRYFKKVRDSTVLPEKDRIFVRNQINELIRQEEEREKQRLLELARQQEEERRRQEARPLTERAWESVRNYWRTVAEEYSSVDTGSLQMQVRILVELLAPFLLVLLLLWYLPIRVVQWHSQGAFAAERKRYLRLARLTGVVGLLIYLASRLAGGGKKKELSPVCSKCHKPLGSPLVFRQLNFKQCPYCGQALRPLYTLKDYIQALGAAIVGEDQEGTRGRNAHQLPPNSVQQLVDITLGYAHHHRAHEIVIDGDELGNLCFRFRIDGVIHDGFLFPLALWPKVLQSLKERAGIQLEQSQKRARGHFSLRSDSSETNVYLVIHRRGDFESATLRLQPVGMAPLGLPQLGMSAQVLDRLQHALESDPGVILWTGPPYSGITTAQLSVLNSLASRQKKIIAIQEIVEYALGGDIQQRQVQSEDVLVAELRAALDERPDVLLVAPALNGETAPLLVRAAQQGCLALGFLPAADSCSVLTRLTELGIPSSDVAAAVIAVVNQRLVRTICPACKVSYRPRPEELEKLSLSPSQVPQETRFYYGPGCAQCHATGFQGMTGLFEVLVVRSEKGLIQKALRAGANAITLQDEARREGCVTLQDEGMAKVLGGITSVAEVLRVLREGAERLQQ